MDTFIETYLLIMITVILYVTIAFLISRLIGNRNDVADIVWGGGFIVVAWMSFGSNLSFHAGGGPALLVTLLVTIWGVRLTWHILRRFLRSPQEDPRYLAMRENWGKWIELQSYLRVFVAQGILLSIIALPVVLINTINLPQLSWLTLLGLAVWVVGFYFEVQGDRQLSDFLKQPANKGKLMTEGLWRYSRHPNYFGEITQWWAIGIMALAFPYGWATLLGPVLITFMIVKVSGVPLVEKRYEGRKDWQSYKQRTSRLFPLPPRQ